MPPFWRIGQGDQFCLLIDPKNTNVVRNVEILLPVKLRWIPLGRFQRRSRKCVSQSEAGWPSWFSDQSEKHKLGRGRLDLTFCQVSLNSVLLIQRSRKCPSQSEAGRPSFLIDLKNTNLVEDKVTLLPVKFRWIPLCSFRGIENVSANQSPGRPSCFSDRPKYTNFVEDVKILLPVKFHWIPFRSFRAEVENV